VRLRTPRARLPPLADTSGLNPPAELPDATSVKKHAEARARAGRSVPGGCRVATARSTARAGALILACAFSVSAAGRSDDDGAGAAEFRRSQAARFQHPAAGATAPAPVEVWPVASLAELAERIPCQKPSGQPVQSFALLGVVPARDPLSLVLRWLHPKGPDLPELKTELEQVLVRHFALVDPVALAPELAEDVAAMLAGDAGRNG
jgi:hypothetical protein